MLLGGAEGAAQPTEVATAWAEMLKAVNFCNICSAIASNFGS